MYLDPEECVESVAEVIDVAVVVGGVPDRGRVAKSHQMLRSQDDVKDALVWGGGRSSVLGAAARRKMSPKY